MVHFRMAESEFRCLMGCVRLEIGNAKWIYDNIPSGTHVVVY